MFLSNPPYYLFLDYLTALEKSSAVFFCHNEGLWDT